MTQKFTRTVLFYFCSGLIISSFLILLTIFAYWKNGPKSTSYLTSVYESSIIYEQLTKENNRINFNLDSNANFHRDVLTNIENIESKINHFSKLNKGQLQTKISSSITDIKNIFLKITSSPDLNSIFKVVISKVDRFNNFVHEKEWKTLDKISSRIQAKLKSDYNSSSILKIQEGMKFVQREIQVMKGLTESSILTEEDKKNILQKIDAFALEFQMIKNLTDEIYQFQKKTIAFNDLFNQWIKEVGPLISVEKINFNKKEQYFLFSLLGIAFLNIVILVMGIIISFKNDQLIKKDIETKITQTIRNGILGRNFHLDMNYSPQFIQEMEKMHQFVQRRMNFGLYFQEGLPFPSVLINQDAKISWANTLFLDLFNLKQNQDEQLNLNWDFISQLTNLTDNNPVTDAIDRNISGIYQIMIRPDGIQKGIPFEMYVTPVQGHQSNKFVMVFFYPLTSLQSSIDGQVESIVTPIKKFLRSEIEYKLSEEVLSSLEKEFEASSTQEIFQNLKKNYDYHSLSNQILTEQIRNLESEVKDFQKLFIDLNKKIPRFSDYQNHFFTKLKELKDYFIHLEKQMETLQKNSKSSMNSFKKVYVESIKYLSTSETLSQNSLTVKQLFEQLSKTRLGLKLYKETFYSAKKSLHQLNNEKTLQIETELSELEKLILTLDIQLSKGEMIFSGTNYIEQFKEQTTQFRETLALEENLIKDVIDEKNILDKQNIEVHDIPVNILGDLHLTYKGISQTIKETKDLINFYSIEGKPEIQVINGPQSTL